MINWLASRAQRPERGWDPVRPNVAQAYADAEWSKFEESAIDFIERWTGPLRGQRVLDLGGGPGQYSVAFARRGAHVTWHDVSATYEGIARRKVREHGVGELVSFSVGYLDDAPRGDGPGFDLVFNRICWNYGRSDAGLARAVFDAVRPGGWGYVDTTISSFQLDTLSASARWRTALNARTGIKIGHPLPPRGRVAGLLLAMQPARTLVDYSSAWNDRILFQRAA
jgi:SAM-dependent methyltransferase